MRIVLLGAPGCGKGTQGARLATHYKIPEISTGEILRAAVAAGTPLGRAAKAVMDAGQLVSDEIVLGVIRERLAQPDVRKGFILDGFPRNLEQAEQLDDLLEQIGQPIDLAILIDTDLDVLMQRLLGRRTCRSCEASFNIFTAPPKMDDSCDECGGKLKRRPDDNEETIGNRIRIYEMQTAPLVVRYREQNRLRVVQGIGDVSDVFAAISKTIEENRSGFGKRTRSAAIRQAVVRQQGQQIDDSERDSKAAQAKILEEPVGMAKPKKAEKRPEPANRKKPAASKKTKVKKKTAVKKKAAGKKKSVVKKKAAIKAKAGVRKKAVAKKKAASQKRKTVTNKKTLAKKKAKAIVKKKASAKKKIVAKKKVAIKKKAATSKKPAAGKKLAHKKKAAARKKAPATRKAISRKKPVKTKKTAKKKAVRKR